ncbi:MAG: DUF4412 domain-containing protein [Alphaproteobacteria bacterium]|nr:DUF4412 domain-containing protein [Alphaproteobacteria bacterium]
MAKLMEVAAGVLALATMDATVAVAVAASPSFTAEAVQLSPGRGSESGRVYISEQGMRFEFQRQGHPVVQIIQPRQGLMRILMLQEKTYMEFRGAAMPDALAEKPTTPCPSEREVHCERTGNDTLNGAPVELWRITSLIQGKGQPDPGPIQVWWDPRNKVVVRQQIPDGSNVTTSLSGHVSYQGRDVEQWVTTYTSANGKSQSATRLHDPELNVDVREEMPTGAVRELRNITLTKMDPAWFVVPADFRKVEANGAKPPGSAPSSSDANPQGRR